MASLVRPSISTATPLASNPQLASARLTGFVTPNTPIIAVNNPTIIPPSSPTLRPSIATPTIPLVVPTHSASSPRRMTIAQATTSTTPTASVSPASRATLAAVGTSRPEPVAPMIPTIKSTFVNPSAIPGILPPGASISVPAATIVIPAATPASPTSIPIITEKIISVSTVSTALPVSAPSDIMNGSFEVRNYQGVITHASLENELLNAGYVPLSKIVVRTEGGDKRTQYIKAMNKNGQKVFIMVDVHGYTTARSTDLTLIESHNVSVVPYSLKTGAYNCASKDVCGVAFECGTRAVCVSSQG